MREKKEDEEKLLTILKELVQIPTYNQILKEHKIIKYLKNKFKDCPSIEEIQDKNGNIHLLVGVNSELQNLDNVIVLSGHIDTVRESDGHTCNLTIEDNILKGLGISDMKSFIATIIANLDYLKSLELPVVLSITSDEETQLQGIEHIIEKFKEKNINPGLIIVGEPTDLNYFVSSRGNSIYVSLMNGIACHSGTPELGVNAIELQTEFLTELIRLKKIYKNNAALCITHIEGGKSPSNIVPDMCSACYGIRTSNTHVLNEICVYLANKHKKISEEYGDSRLFNVLNIPPFERRVNEFICSQANINGKSMFDAKYSTEAGYFQREYPESTILIYGPGQPEKIHEAGEYLDPNKLFIYCEELKILLNNYLKNIKDDMKKLKYNKE